MVEVFRVIAIILLHSAIYAQTHPVLHYMTRFGGSRTEGADAIATDGEGNVYIGGSTLSSDFPGTKGTRPGKPLFFVTKIDRAGQRLFTTMLGPQDDYGLFGNLTSIAVDADRNIVVAGVTFQTTFPTTAGAVQRTNAGRLTGIVAKISADGERVLFATYLGGSEDESYLQVRIEPLTQRIVVVGNTQSSDFPVTSGAYQRERPAISFGGFVTKFSPLGEMLYSTYLTSSARLEISSTTVAGDGSVYIVGHAWPGSLPITPGRKSNQTGGFEGFVTRFKADLSGILDSTFLGDPGVPASAFDVAEIQPDEALILGGHRFFRVKASTPIEVIAPIGAPRLSSGLMAVVPGGPIYVAGNVKESIVPLTEDATSSYGSGAPLGRGFLMQLRPEANYQVSFATYLPGDSYGAVGLATGGDRVYLSAPFSGSPTAGVYQTQFGSVMFMSYRLAATPCNTSVNPTTVPFGISGGFTSISVQVPTGCPWFISDDVPWFSMVQSGGNVALTVEPNPGVARSGIASVAGKDVTVQQPSNCSYSVTAHGLSVSGEGGNSFFSVATGPGCPWTMSSNADWLVVHNLGFPGPLDTFTTAFRNGTGKQRVATVQVAGQSFQITQLATGCVVDLSPINGIVGAQGADLKIDINTSQECRYMLSATGMGFTVLGNETYQGSRQVQLTSTANTGTSPRMGLLSLWMVDGMRVMRVPFIQAAPRTQRFEDVPASRAEFDYIALIAARGVTIGCTATKYCPDDPVTREQMAAFIVRAKEGREDFVYTETPYFEDVPTGHAMFKYVQKLADLGITKGCTANRFCPGATVTRQQMAQFLSRSLWQTGGSDAPYFVDVAGSGEEFFSVQKIRDFGITSGCRIQAYCPGDPTTRAQMAVFLSRSLLTPP